MKTGFFQTVKQVVRWVASLIEDKRGSVSHKRILALWGMWILTMIYKNPEKYDSTMVWPIIVFIASAAAFTLPEWFSNLKSKNNETN